MDQLLQTLGSAISHTLENVIFSEVDKITMMNESAEWPRSGFAVSIDLNHPYRGRVVLVLDDACAAFIYEGMTGEEYEGDNKAIVSDALSELANTIVGRYLFEIVPQDVVFELGLPDCRRIEETNEEYFKIAESQVIALVVEEKQFFAVLRVERQAGV